MCSLAQNKSDTSETSHQCRSSAHHCLYIVSKGSTVTDHYHSRLFQQAVVKTSAVLTTSLYLSCSSLYIYLSYLWPLLFASTMFSLVPPYTAITCFYHEMPGAAARGVSVTFWLDSCCAPFHRCILKNNLLRKIIKPSIQSAIKIYTAVWYTRDTSWDFLSFAAELFVFPRTSRMLIASERTAADWYSSSGFKDPRCFFFFHKPLRNLWVSAKCSPHRTEHR